LVLIVSDVRFYRDGVAAALGAEGTQAEACGHGELAAVMAGEPAEVAVVDLGDRDFLRSLEGLRERWPRTRLVGLTMTETADAVVAAAACSVRAFVSREQSLAELLATVQCAAANQAVCPPTVADVLFERAARREFPALPETVLTPREHEITTLIARGLTNKEIAATLVIGPATVKNHVHSILGKLGVQRRGEAAAMFRR
jgi:two-component system, NarL family, nitrate/nitrite response regulator NarL